MYVCKGPEHSYQLEVDRLLAAPVPRQLPVMGRGTLRTKGHVCIFAGRRGIPPGKCYGCGGTRWPRYTDVGCNTPWPTSDDFCTCQLEEEASSTGRAEHVDTALDLADSVCMSELPLRLSFFLADWSDLGIHNAVQPSAGHDRQDWNTCHAMGAENSADREDILKTMVAHGCDDSLVSASPEGSVAAVESHFSFDSVRGTGNMLGGGCTGYGRGRQLFLHSHDMGSLCTEWKGVWEPLDGLMFRETGGRPVAVEHLKGAMAMNQALIPDATTFAAPATLCSDGQQSLVAISLQAHGDLQATMAYLVNAGVKTWALRQATNTKRQVNSAVVVKSRSVAGNVSGSIEGIALHEHGLLYKRMWDPAGRNLL